VSVPNGVGVSVGGCAHDTSLTGNVVSGNATAGVAISGGTTTGVVLQGNSIGTDAAGAAARPNGIGIRIDAGSDGNTVGGTAAGTGNLVSGNGVGVQVAGSGGTKILGNRIGTNAAGTAAIANGTGVEITNGAGGTTIGSNVISGNTSAGIFVWNFDTYGTLIAGNLIGTNASGTSALGNGGGGVLISGDPDGTVVGGDDAESRNVISGNGTAGVRIGGPETDALVAGNYIGTDKDGGGAVPNALGVRIDTGAAGSIVRDNVISGNTGYGVSIASAAMHNDVRGNRIGTTSSGQGALGNGGGVGIFGASLNAIGGLSEELGNTIAGNAGPGVIVDAATGAAYGNSILLNSIYGNAANGIVLTAGGNDGQAAPKLSKLKQVKPGKKATIKGTLQSAPLTQFRIEIYVSQTCTQGQSFLGGGTLATNKKGKASFKLLTYGGLSKGTAVTSTATNLSTLDTSGFSTCVVVR
jgi:parallel beta helix pectate lyase-like protein